MSSVVSKNHPPPSEVPEINIETSEDGGEEETSDNQRIRVTSHICLKPDHSAGTLDKDAVLRRIRHRKRMSKFQNAGKGLKAVFSFTQPHQRRWVDDAFAAP